MFSEDHEVRISNLIDNLLTRLEFEVQKQAPQHLPSITNAVIILHGYKSGQIKMDEKHMMEITLLKNINNEVKDFRKGNNMAGTLTGGKKAAETNKALFGENWYRIIGQKGGKRKVPKGFALNRELAQEAGRLGGLVSRRGR